MTPHVSNYLKTYEEFPPAQKAASFTISDALEVLQEAGGGK